jgi:hypothetical protein
MIGKTESSSRPTVAIIGDWFIDEYWLLTRQHAYHSSAPGDVHYVARQTNADKAIVGLCGAPAVFEMLRTYFEKKKAGSPFEFVGFGVWNHVDDPILKCALCAADHLPNKLLTPYTLAGLPVPPDNDLCPYGPNEGQSNKCKNASQLYNLARKPKDYMPDPAISTNRIIRCFEGHGGTAPHLIHRIDWRLPVSEEHIDDSPLNILAAKKLKAIVLPQSEMEFSPVWVSINLNGGKLEHYKPQTL